MDIALKNGGGIRNSINGPNVTRFLVAQALAFNNKLAIVEIAGHELLAAMENAISRYPSLDGRFPQVAGIELEFDPNRPGISDQISLRHASRIGNLTVIRASGERVELIKDFRVVGNLDQTFFLATNNFLLTGGDGYTAFKAINDDPARKVLIPETGEQQILENYIVQAFGGTVNVPTKLDRPRVQVYNYLKAEGTYSTGAFDESAAEIVTFDPVLRRLFVSNAFNNSVEVLDASNPKRPEFLFSVQAAGGNVNSVAVHNGIVALAVENNEKTENGFVLFVDGIAGTVLNKLEVGALPDMLTFTPDGSKVLVANEGEPNDDYTIDPRGSVSIIDLGSGSFMDVVMAKQSDVTPITFEAFDPLTDIFRSIGIRIFGRINDPLTGEFLRESKASEDLEPEYIAVSPDGKKAFATMQENNAIAVIDLETNTLIDLAPLGFKDHSIEGNGLDASDKDGGINIQTWPVMGMYMPDAIASFESLGKTFVVSANEGDSRDYDGFSEEVRVEDLVLDQETYPEAEMLQASENLGRLKTTITMGDYDEDGDVDQIFSYGARSFSVWDEEGNLVWDSGDEFERRLAELMPENFNSANDENDSFDSRSDDKGAEPEAITIGEVDGRILAFIGLERVGGIFIYDVTYPYAPKYVNYLNNRDFTVVYESGSPNDVELNAIGDLGPEGIIFVSGDKTPSGEPMLMVANEVSGNTTIFTVRIPPMVDYKLQVLHSSDNESAFQNPNTLESTILNYGTVMHGLQAVAAKEGIPSIYLTAGDHTLPGPFYQASAEVPEFGAPGLADIALFNAMGLTANGIGNHEFDGGINDFARMLSKANYPFIAVNLDFSKVELESGAPAIRRGVDGGSVEENAGKVVRSAYVEVGGEKIGLIGRAPADFFNVISDPASTLPGLDFIGGRNPEDNQPLVSALQFVHEQVALLESKGINKIILLDHAQDFTADPLSASSLHGIDIVVAAGSTGFMARPEAEGPFNMLRPEDASSAAYPTERTDADGHTVLVVNSEQLYRYVGNLIVGFDPEGHINFIDDRSGPVATTKEAIKALESYIGDFKLETPSEVTAIYRSLTRTELIRKLYEVVGETTAPLNGLRADVRSRETNLGRLAADSTLWFARSYVADNGLDIPVDIALKNGGGIRSTISGPAILQLQVEAALAFNNKLGILPLTAEQLIASMENAVSRYPARDGRFPQVAGMFLEYDAEKEGVSDQVTLSVPSRLKTLVIFKQDGTEDVVVENYTAQGDLNRVFWMATNNFLLTGGDGYAAFKAVNDNPDAQVIIPEMGEQQILKDYIQDELDGMVVLPEPLLDSRIVNIHDVPMLTAYQVHALTVFGRVTDDAAPEADFDKDGISNYTEFHFASGSDNPDSRPMVQAGANTEGLITLRHTRAAGSDATWVYEATEDLINGTWDTLVEGEHFQMLVTEQDGVETVELQTLNTGFETLFVRVRVE
ncbi:MAG: choice-of-anchor I family protein [Verrucomicrobiota bacterium]